MRIATTLAAVFAVAGTIGIAFAQRTSPPAPVAQVGHGAPDFTLTDSQGRSHRLGALRGKIVVLEWTNPGCPFVKRHARERSMDQARASVPASRVVWLGIDSSHFVTPEAIERWRRDVGVPNAILLDRDGRVGHLYGARATPHMFVIDAAGVLRYSGAIDDDPHDREPNPTNFVTRALVALVRGGAVPASNAPYGCSVKYGEPASR
jgi:peroxiredoxin